MPIWLWKPCVKISKPLLPGLLFYCSSFWGGISMKKVLKLQSVQKFGARIIISTRKYDHIQPIIRDLNWLNVESTIKYRDGIMAFKCMNGYAPECLCHQFILRSKIHSRNTRNKDKLAIPLCKTAAGQKSFVYRATSIWNGLSEDLINLNNLNSFKTDFTSYHFLNNSHNFIRFYSCFSSISSVSFYIVNYFWKAILLEI